MLNREQGQSVTDNSCAIQVGGDVNVGLSYSEAKDLALTVFEANFYRLAEIAKGTARQRAEEITESFLDKLKTENPLGLEQANDPDFQCSLFNAQKGYARCGDKELEDLLVNLLVDRTRQDERNLIQVVLNESIKTAPMLTRDQYPALAIAFLLRHTRNHSIIDKFTLGNYFDVMIKPFLAGLSVSETSYRHIEFCGCGSISINSISLEKIFRNTYQALFQNGIDIDEFNKIDLPDVLKESCFMKAMHNNDKLQIRFMDKDALMEYLESEKVAKDYIDRIYSIFDNNTMSEAEIKSRCIEIRPYMTDVFDRWSSSSISHLQLTSVGVAIGHSYLKHITGDSSSLSVWIN